MMGLYDKLKTDTANYKEKQLRNSFYLSDTERQPTAANQTSTPTKTTINNSKEEGVL